MAESRNPMLIQRQDMLVFINRDNIKFIYYLCILRTNKTLLPIRHWAETFPHVEFLDGNPTVDLSISLIILLLKYS